MNHDWKKEAVKEGPPHTCPLDRKMLQKIYVAICGDEETGMEGFAQRVPKLEKRVGALETKNLTAATAGFSIGKAAMIVGSFIVGLGVLAGAIVVVVQFFTGKH